MDDDDGADDDGGDDDDDLLALVVAVVLVVLVVGLAEPAAVLELVRTSAARVVVESDSSLTGFEIFKESLVSEGVRLRVCWAPPRDVCWVALRDV